MEINNVYINQGLKVPVTPGQNATDPVVVGFKAEATGDNVRTLMSIYGTPQTVRIKIDEYEFDSLLEKSQFIIENINKYPTVKFRLSCYYKSADLFLSLMGKEFNIKIV